MEPGPIDNGTPGRLNTRSKMFPFFQGGLVPEPDRSYNGMQNRLHKLVA
jgi:hypothetical protein